MKKSYLILALIISTLFAAETSSAQVDPEWLSSWNEAVESQPSNISSFCELVTKDEPGHSLRIAVKIFNLDETPAEGVLVHIYHRDAQGFDFGKNDAEYSTWRIQGWAKTDETGSFTFKTIRPKSDHLGREAAHFHFTTSSKKYGRQWAPKVFLSDEELLTEAQHLRSQRLGKFTWICETKVMNGSQYVEVNLKLKGKPDF